jgi:hypothetical protein
MKAIFGTLMLVLAMQAQAQTNLEDDLDGNASSLVSSDMPRK